MSQSECAGSSNAEWDKQNESAYAQSISAPAPRELLQRSRQGVRGTEVAPHFHGCSLGLLPAGPLISATSCIKTGSRNSMVCTRVPVMARWNSYFVKVQPAWPWMLFWVQETPRMQLGIFACVISAKIIYAWEHTILPLPHFFWAGKDCFLLSELQESFVVKNLVSKVKVAILNYTIKSKSGEGIAEQQWLCIHENGWKEKRRKREVGGE